MNETDQESVWEALDYKHDAIIEASAGTGKTYALEHIVKHLVETNGIGDIRNLLLVTFTEKAAGELKERIRKILVEANTEACSSAAKHLDETTICTIHSFCQELLREYPFESGMQMVSDVVNSDMALIERAVRSSIANSKFRDNYGDCFAEVMEKWNDERDANGLCNYTIQKLEDIIVSGLSPKEWFSQKIESVKSSFVSILNRMPGEKQEPGAYILTHSSKLGKSQDDDEEYKKYFAELDANISKLLSDESDVTADMKIKAAELIAEGNLEFKLQTWNGVQLKPTVRFCDKEGLGVYKELADMASGFGRNLKDKILMKLWLEAHKEYFRLKKRSRTMTFDDMVLEVSRMVKDAVNDVDNAAKQAFLKTLRMRYRIVLVDEFQDTDNKQWTIFSSLFSNKIGEIEGVNPKQGCLIVVGDPKQAIYGFRGADIGTYLTAKKEIEDGGGQRFQLKEMFRSTKEMVDSFNLKIAVEVNSASARQLKLAG